MRFLILIGLISLSGCFWNSAPIVTPIEPKPCTGVFKQDAGDFTVYLGNDGQEHKCSKPGGHCKGATYNGCSASAEKCCYKP